MGKSLLFPRKSRWAPQPIVTLRSGGKSFALTGIKPRFIDHLGRNLLAKLTDTLSSASPRESHEYIYYYYYYLLKLSFHSVAAVLTLVTKTKLNSVALVGERTIPKERPPTVGEVSTNFCG
jgi:hypothetical protein